jgi:hypothetical protein
MWESVKSCFLCLVMMSEFQKRDLDHFAAIKQVQVFIAAKLCSLPFYEIASKTPVVVDVMFLPIFLLIDDYLLSFSSFMS